MTNESHDEEPLDGELPDELWDTLDDLYELAEDDPEEAYQTFLAFPKDMQEIREFQMALAGIEKHTDRFAEAKRRLERLLGADPDDADVHHQYADLLEDLGEEKQASHHFLETLRLDEAEAPEASPEIFERIERVVREIVLDLPEPFQSKLKSVPILIEPRPAKHLVEEGLDPRSLGLFEGANHGADLNYETKASPTRIVIFAECLVREVGDGPELDDEVAITVLHEIGHYFGLEEEDMERLGLS